MEFNTLKQAFGDIYLESEVPKLRAEMDKNKEQKKN